MPDNTVVAALGEKAVAARNARAQARDDFGTDSTQYKVALEAERVAQEAFQAARTAARAAAQSTDAAN